MNDWFFNIYLPKWVAMGADPSSGGPDGILDYWGVPLHAASVNMTKCLMTGQAVIGLLHANQDPLQAANYTHTVVLDRHVKGYNSNAGSIDVIWSRRRADESEIERRAVHFEIHRTTEGWRVIAIASTLTERELLSEIWETV
ncbi:DUF6841 family protein [Variovorax ginsengisoli]|uniref:DUF6841 domain-containing protein n=1 Tax=Variovorax ginsengisoli TaxID=363844 RepID=A0ABT8SE25_9BURK|nr:hypothetical protein [Variovorax ginsengisoli]MDN8617429.1 hypothetical protein [Variovorax ginsengisoli]MDO1536599.1 hypothetical protein [Variovorax ginsengisoli]